MEYKVENNEIELDTCGTECPIPVLKARKLCKAISKGSVIKVMATDPLAGEDFKHLCEQSGYELLSIKIEKKIITITFKT